jgi:hypothetical protein
MGRPAGLPGDVPAGHVDGRFGIEMPRQRQVHRAFHIQHAARIEAQHEGCHGLDPGADARAMGGHIGVAPGRAFAPAGDPASVSTFTKVASSSNFSRPPDSQ